MTTIISIHQPHPIPPLGGGAAAGAAYVRLVGDPAVLDWAYDDILFGAAYDILAPGDAIGINVYGCMVFYRY